MKEVSKLKTSVGIDPGLTKKMVEEADMSKHTPPPTRLPRRITLQSTIDWINEKNYSQEIKQYLIRLVKNRPNGSLVHFRKNIEQYVKGWKNEEKRKS